MIKNKKFSGVLTCGSLLLALLALTGCHCLPCSANSQSASVSAPSTHFIQMAPIAPPAALHEDVPDIESPRTAVWRPGHWEYTGSDFSWTPGEVIDRPSPTAVWSQDRWVEHTYGWGFVPGYWQ